MSWADDEFFYPHTVEVRDRVAGGGMGSTYAAARTLAAEVEDEQKLVRAADNSEVVSSAQVTLPLPQHVPVGSLVTVWPGTPAERQSTVLAVNRHENAEPLDSFVVLSLK